MSLLISSQGAPGYANGLGNLCLRQWLAKGSAPLHSQLLKAVADRDVLIHVIRKHVEAKRVFVFQTYLLRLQR